MSRYLKMSIASVCFTLALLASGTAVLAHNSFATVYDQTKPVRVEGTAVRIDWRNPHFTFYVTSLEAEASSATWSFEMGSQRLLTRQFEWAVDTITVGDHITIEGFAARAGERYAAARYVTTASGERLSPVRQFR